MPELLSDGLPERASRSRFDFSEWADGQAWQFVRGKDYTSTTASFRHNVKRWAKAHGYLVETRPLLDADPKGRPLPASQADPVGLAVCFTPATTDRPRSADRDGDQRVARAA
jgi:hypothetical protein